MGSLDLQIEYHEIQNLYLSFVKLPDAEHDAGGRSGRPTPTRDGDGRRRFPVKLGSSRVIYIVTFPYITNKHIHLPFV